MLPHQSDHSVLGSNTERTAILGHPSTTAAVMTFGKPSCAETDDAAVEDTAGAQPSAKTPEFQRNGGLTLVEADGRFREARSARILFDSPAA